MLWIFIYLLNNHKKRAYAVGLLVLAGGSWGRVLGQALGHRLCCFSSCFAVCQSRECCRAGLPHAARLPARSVSVPWPGYGAGGGLGPAGHPPALHVGLVWFVRWGSDGWQNVGGWVNAWLSQKNGGEQRTEVGTTRWWRSCSCNPSQCLLAVWGPQALVCECGHPRAPRGCCREPGPYWQPCLSTGGQGREINAL